MGFRPAMSDARDSLASIRWWPKDWRASAARAALSPTARGVYLDLLFAQFLEPDCDLPDDDKRHMPQGKPGLPADRMKAYSLD